LVIYQESDKTLTPLSGIRTLDPNVMHIVQCTLRSFIVS